MGRNVDKRTLFLRALIVVAVVLSVALYVCIFVARHDVAQARDTSEEARGLDIVRYDPPKWGGDKVSECWYLVDRLNNHKFWLLKIDGQWTPLDIGEVENLG